MSNNNTIKEHKPWEPTPKELRNISYRWSWHRSLSWNYEKMMGLGYLSTLVPFIEKNYQDDEEGRINAYKIHTPFFNSSPDLTNLILGINVSIESKLGKKGHDTVIAMKNSLMGPFAGIGDSLTIIINLIFGAIAIGMAKEGNPLWWLIWLCWNFVLMFCLRPLLLKTGYKQSMALVTTLGDKIKNLNNAASIIGLVVVGGLVANFVTVKLGTVSISGTQLDLQAAVFDRIMPNFGNVLITLLCYFLLGKKSFSIVKIIWLIMVLVFILSFLGIIAVP